MNDIVIAGDRAVDIDAKSAAKVILGPGLRRLEGKVLVTKCGVLKQKDKVTFWVDGHQKRYVPARGEFVIGIVTNKAGDYFKVDIGSSEPASLSYLSFEGATKKNRPDINVGDALYTKVLSANKDMEPELVCVDSNWKKGVAGLLEPNGFIFTCSLNLVQKCLEDNHKFIDRLGKKIPLEIAIGLNGRIWVRTDSFRNTMFVINAILSAELLNKEEMMKCID